MADRNGIRGSEWRKWDLHLHCPGTKLADGFGGNDAPVWDRYCGVLHSSDVHAFGITDYFSADGYERCVAEYRSRYKDCPKLLFLNLELRTNDVVNKAKEEVNIHLIFNPAVSDFIRKAKDFLGFLETSKHLTGGVPVHASALTTKSDYEEATVSRAQIRTALEKVYGKDVDLSEFVLTLAAANNDGIRADSGSKRKQLISDEVDKFCDAFLGHPGNTDYFLNIQRLEDQNQSVLAKPVFSGCDAHSFEVLETGLGKVLKSHSKHCVPTWIKADVTFEGLKQTLFEPSERVFLGEEPDVRRRVRENATHYIEALHVTCNEGYANSCGKWFHEEMIPLNKELVAIIGNKGSGKSALADIVGLLGNSHNQKGRSASRSQEILFSFLNDEKFLKNRFASHFGGELHWYAGTADRKSLDSVCDTALPEKVEYLPQKYLERICANVEYAEFESTLKEVIFGYVPEDQQFENKTFDDLIDYLTSQADQEITAIREELHEANERVARMERNLTLTYSQELAERIRMKQEEFDNHQANPPPERSKPDEDVSPVTAAALQSYSTEIDDTAEKIRQLEIERHEASSLQEQLRQAKEAIQRSVRELMGLETKYSSLLASAGLAFSNIVNVDVRWDEFDQTASKTSERVAEIRELLAAPDHIAQIGDESAQSASAARSLRRKLADLSRNRTDLIEQLGKPQRDYEEYRRLYTIWSLRGLEILGAQENPAAGTLRDLQMESSRISDEYPAVLIALRAERDAISKRVFESKLGLIEFYDRVKAEIEGEITKHRSDLGDYAISIDAELSFDSAFYDEFFAFIAQNRVGTFYGKDDGRAALQRLTSPVLDWEEHGQVSAFLTSVCDALLHDRRPHMDGARMALETQLRDRKTATEVYDYLYGFEYLNPKYELKVDGKQLSALSAGERGGLLLVFYLMLDRRDIPLIIDQPEDNLDNKSVYEILVRFLKKAKRRRQIIIVTHNPNLAVVADAEQIIHVRIDKKDQNDFSFVAGSIENPEINARVVDILEGTRPAFDNRRLKYRNPAAN